MTLAATSVWALVGRFVNPSCKPRYDLWFSSSTDTPNHTSQALPRIPARLYWVSLPKIWFQGNSDEFSEIINKVVPLNVIFLVQDLGSKQNMYNSMPATVHFEAGRVMLQAGYQPGQMIGAVRREHLAFAREAINMNVAAPVLGSIDRKM
jgi:hypothetical protein